ncbi:MAG: type II secretion system F family protein [Jatrophihabitans sp.]|uniref:type II secretion system F family protein n=1 Tax=Jatrophihabitans sp. TaxID=1932789 RepID=UPI00390F884C
MTGALTWLLVGSSVLFVPSPRRRGDGPGDEADRAARRGAARARAAVGLAVGAAGAGCLAALGLRTGVLAAAVVCPSVAVLQRWLPRRPSRPDLDDELPLVLDLAAAALRSGRPVADALALAAPAAGPDTATTLLRVAGLSRLGADAAQAWSGVPRAGPLGELAGVAVRSAASGIKLAAALERLATQLRAEGRAAAAARAARSGVTAMAPLAACFLPSFVCLGVIPVIVGVAKSAFGVLP